MVVGYTDYRMALYDPEWYNPEMRDTNAGNTHLTFKIARIRHFYDFQSIGVVDHRQEITLYYGGERASNLEYYLPEFIEYLKIFDSNGEQLQFHSELREYFEDAPDSNTTNDGLKIIIEFPKSRPLLKNSFRTITVEDKIDFDIAKMQGAIFITVPFDEAPRTYLYINKIPRYKANINHFFFSRDDVSKDTPLNFFKLDQTRESEFLDVYEKTSFYCIASLVPINNCNVIIPIEYTLGFTDIIWFYGGILFGLVTLIEMAFFILNVHLLSNRISDSLTQIAAMSTIAITFLVFIKGWVFTKDLDDVITVFPNDYVKISFSDFYILLITLMFIGLIEIFCIVH